MAAPKTNPESKKVCNFVAQDEIWRTRIISELEAAKKWPHDWGFLKTSYQELVGEDAAPQQRKKIELPEHLRVRAVTPVEKYIQVKPSPPVPQTTQKLVGWRSTVPGLELECYKESRRGKYSFVKQMNWPIESID
ncbi:uncharacterized protein C20orf85 homolog [Protopterus annectens]|uniref:uncharacterized protein C20orf85 homolog n=1 Tax=Protopterus annectens TaxID=7888 RepID=UPI001CFBD6B9|nr:uncharacterized protein C20orf85 homolog [Protopterus annectens]